MADERLRELERKALRGDAESLDQLRAMWLRTVRQVRCSKCGGWYAEHDLAEHEEGCESVASKVVVLPQTGMVAARPRKNPLYDREELPANSSRCFFFDHCAGKGIWDSNLFTNGVIPPSTHFYLYQFLLIPDADSDPKDLALVRDRGALSFQFQQTTLTDHPLRAVLADQPRVTDQDGEEWQLYNEWEAGRALPVDEQLRMTRLAEMEHRVDMTIMGRPIELSALFQFRWELSLPPGVFLKKPFTSMLVMYGLLLRGIS